MSVSKYNGKRWRARVFENGRPLASKVFDLKRDAEAWESEQNRKLLAGQWVDPRAGTASLAEVIDAYLNELKAGNPKTYDTVETNMRLHISARLKRQSIRSITAGQLDTLYTELLKKPLSRATVARVRDGLSSLFAWAVRKEMLAENTVTKSALPKGAQRSGDENIEPFSEIELRATLAAQYLLHEWYAEVTEFAALTGLRWGEIVALRVRDYTPGHIAYIHVTRSASDGYDVKTTKSNRRRRVPLVERAEEIVAARAEDRNGSDFLFTAPHGGRLNGGNYKRAIKWSVTSEGHRFHDLRHTAATNWLADGVDVKTVSVWLGHSSPTVTLRVYVHWLGESGDIAALALVKAGRRKNVAR